LEFFSEKEPTERNKELEPGKRISAGLKIGDDKHRDSHLSHQTEVTLLWHNTL